MARSPNGVDMKPDDLLPLSDSEIAEPSKAASGGIAQDADANPSTPDLVLPSHARAGLPPGTSLVAIYRFLVGIENDIALVPSHLAQKKAIDPIATGTNKGRRAVNLGIYNRAIREEQACMFYFRFWSICINLALGLQIIFAAILTALGAGHGPADAVAVFGALNTIIAGFLTYIKGTGLPMRWKYFYNHWLKLRAYIEQRERDFASDDSTTIHRFGYRELMEEIDIVEKMYHNIRKDIERHTPDSFSGNKGEDSQAAANAPGEGATESQLANMGIQNRKAAGMTGGGDTLGRIRNQLEQRVQSLVEDVEHRMSSHVSNRLSQMEESGKQGVRTTTKTTPNTATDLERGPEPNA